MDGITVACESDAIIVTLEEDLATFLGRRSFGESYAHAEFERFAETLPYDRPICIDADQVMSQEPLVLPCLSILGALIAILVERGFIVALLHPAINFASFVVLYGGVERTYTIGDVIVPASYESHRSDSR